MVRERKDFYQLKKAVGEDPVPEAEVAAAGAAADTTGETDAAPGASTDPVQKRKKKKAKRARSVSEVEVEAGDDSGVPETADLPADSAAVVPPTTAREEVISSWP
jgi:hypothetical protein